MTWDLLWRYLGPYAPLIAVLAALGVIYVRLQSWLDAKQAKQVREACATLQRQLDKQGLEIQELRAQMSRYEDNRQKALSLMAKALKARSTHEKDDYIAQAIDAHA